ncbi:MAG TPA: type I-F CRISPR-associated protein Csy2 [Rhodoferax sp.]|nr:type I-F CRISPR-associated protein Csy2 [Rhodoferax sp.]
MTYLVIPSMRVHGANLLTSNLVAGGPPLMACALFAHQVAREAGARDLGFFLIHHDRQELGQFIYGRLHGQQRRGAMFIDGSDYSSTNKQALSLQPTLSAHLRVSVVIKFDDLQDVDAVHKMLERGKFSGGTVLSHGQIETEETLQAAFKRVPSGFVLRDKSIELEQPGESRAAVLIKKLAANPQLLDAHPPWLAATTLGYATLTEFKHKGGVREGVEHAFAEPLTGLVQYVSLRKAASELKSLMWACAWPHPDVFLLSQRS